MNADFFANDTALSAEICVYQRPNLIGKKLDAD